MTKKLLLLNGFAILVVPLHHATSYGLQAMFFWTNRYLPVSVPNFDQMGSIQYYVTMTIRQLDTFAVPAFLFVSGYFISIMARGERDNISWNVVLPRVKILLIPLILWTAVRNLLLLQVPNSLDDVLNPYTFLLLLIQLYLISPFIVPLAKKRWQLLLIVAAIFQLGVQTIKYLSLIGVEYQGQELLAVLTPRWFFLTQQPFWFPLGLVIGLHLSSFNTWLGRVKRPLFFATILLGAAAVAEYLIATGSNSEAWDNPSYAGYTRTFYILALLLWYLTIDEKKLPFSNSISKLSTKSLGIYLANIPIIYMVAVIFWRFTPLLLGKQFFYQGLLYLAGLLGPILLMEVIRRSPARRWYRYVFG